MARALGFLDHHCTRARRACGCIHGESALPALFSAQAVTSRMLHQIPLRISRLARRAIQKLQP
ncbi:hypothetical protein IW139_006301, partial [Coemansia sp. RSA 353]